MESDHLLYSCLTNITFHISLESQLDIVQLTAIPHPPCGTTLLIIFLSSLFLLSILVNPLLTSPGSCPNNYSSLFIPLTTSASAWLKYSVFSRVMMSSVTSDFLAAYPVLWNCADKKGSIFGVVFGGFLSCLPNESTWIWMVPPGSIFFFQIQLLALITNWDWLLVACRSNVKIY